MPQGLDRRITVELYHVEGTGQNRKAVVDATHDVWASLRDDSQERIIESGGTRGSSQRVYIIRWLADVASHDPRTVRVSDATLGISQRNIVSKRELTDDGRQRRRWLELVI